MSHKSLRIDIDITRIFAPPSHLATFLLHNPKGGKTTAITELQIYLRENGFRVFVVPEAATMLLVNGASPSDFASPERQKAFQQFVINTQLQLEERWCPCSSDLD